MPACQSHLLIGLWRARPPTNSPAPPPPQPGHEPPTTSLQHRKRARISSLVCPGSTLVTTRVRRHTKAHHRRDASSRRFSAERGDGNLRAHSVRSGVTRHTPCGAYSDQIATVPIWVPPRIPAALAASMGIKRARKARSRSTLSVFNDSFGIV